MKPQFSTDTRPLDKTDHVWEKRGEVYQCVICGVSTKKPPPYPTPDEWRSEIKVGP